MRSRFVCVAGGVILIVMKLIPALGALVEAVPQFVRGGAGIAAIATVVLNAYFNGIRQSADAQRAALASASHVEAG